MRSWRSCRQTFPTGRVLQGTALARATAVQCMAGIQHPVAGGSVRLGHERSPRLADADSGRGASERRPHLRRTEEPRRSPNAAGHQEPPDTAWIGAGRRRIRYSTRWRNLLFSEDQPTGNRQGTGSSTLDTAIRHFSAGLRIYDKDPTRIPLFNANQPRGHDQGAIEHFVRRFTRAAPLPHRGLRAAPE